MPTCPHNCSGAAVSSRHQAHYTSSCGHAVNDAASSSGSEALPATCFAACRSVTQPACLGLATQGLSLHCAAIRQLSAVQVQVQGSFESAVGGGGVAAACCCSADTVHTARLPKPTAGLHLQSAPEPAPAAQQQTWADHQDTSRCPHHPSFWLAASRHQASPHAAAVRPRFVLCMPSMPCQHTQHTSCGCWIQQSHPPVQLRPHVPHPSARLSHMYTPNQPHSSPALQAVQGSGPHA
jgi:hypothetical protein